MMYRIENEDKQPVKLSSEIINYFIKYFPEEIKTDDISDGYHTFKELYEHRVALFIALCNTLRELDIALSDNMDNMYIPEEKYVWKSKLHSDGTMYDGWFIAGIGNKKGETLTYHIPIEKWNDMQSCEIDNAPEWDGHTSKDVIRLLNKI